MARFAGEVGYAIDPTDPDLSSFIRAGGAAEVTPGVWQDIIVEKTYYGDVLRTTRKLDNGQSVNDDISVNNSVSIVADAFANDHFFAIRYVRWAGTLWKVTEVVVESPRLILRLGGVYNGPKPESSTSPASTEA